MSSPVPVTAVSNKPLASEDPSVVVIGEKAYGGEIPGDSAGFYFVVVNLTSLEVVAQAAPVSNSTVPPEIAPYAGKDGYFLFFLTQHQSTACLPQGELYTFLMASGAGAALENLEQVVAQLGTGIITSYAYVLAGALDSGDLPGFEAFSFDTNVILPMQFVPYTVGDQTMYAPSRYTTP